MSLIRHLFYTPPHRIIARIPVYKTTLINFLSHSLSLPLRHYDQHRDTAEVAKKGAMERLQEQGVTDADAAFTSTSGR